MKLVLVLMAAVLTAAAQPTNAQLETRKVDSTLEALLNNLGAANATGAFWVGFTAPASTPDRRSCCTYVDNDVAWSGCSLSGDNIKPGADTGPVRLEAPQQVTVLFRMEGGALNQIRTFSGDCPLDAGGLKVYWLESVPPATAFAYFESVILAEKNEKFTSSAINALAMQAGSAPALISIAQKNPKPYVRERVYRWLGRLKDPAAFTHIESVLKR